MRGIMVHVSGGHACCRIYRRPFTPMAVTVQTHGLYSSDTVAGVIDEATAENWPRIGAAMSHRVRTYAFRSCDSSVELCRIDLLTLGGTTCLTLLV